MNVTWLISRTSPALSRAMARAKVRHRASSVERSCSPTSQTMIGLASVSFRLEVGRSETVKKEIREGPWLSCLRLCEKVALPGSGVPPPTSLCQPDTSGLLSCPPDRTPFQVTCLG